MLTKPYLRLNGIWPCLMALLLFVALLGPLMAPYDPAIPNYRLRLSSASMMHLMGTDHLGRDILSRVLVGARASLGVSVLIATIATLLGVTAGVVSVMGGRWTDSAMTRSAEVAQTMPAFIVAVTVAAAFGPSEAGLVIALAALNWTTHARLTRGLVRSISLREHVTAARLYGVSPTQLFRRHYLPLIAPALLVTWSENWSRAVLAVSGLGFLGFGVPPPQPEWGSMLADGRSYLGVAPVVMLGPGLAIVISVLMINLFGDWLRDTVASDTPRAA